MSDQGDAGTWRPATSQNDQYSAPDDTTGPLPKITDGEAGEQGFPSVNGPSASAPSPSWAASDDDAPTGGFPAVSPAEDPPAPVPPSSRSPFEPSDRMASPRESTDDVEDPGPNGATPMFGTEVPDPRPAEKPYGSFDDSSFGDTPLGDSSFGESSFGTSSLNDGSSFGGSSPGASSFGSGDSSFGSSSFGSDEPTYGSGGSSYRSGESSYGSGESSYGTGESSFGSSSFGSGSYGESSFGSTSFDDKPGDAAEPAYGRDSSFGSTSFDDRPGDAPEPGYGRETFSAESGGAGAGAPAGTGMPENAASGTGAFSLPRAEKRPTAEDEAAENDFFAPDDHPPMWDKVVAPSGPPPKPGKPSSGNLRLPDWMRDEAAAAGDGAGDGAGGGAAGGAIISSFDRDEDRSRRPLFIGVGILVAGLVAVAGVYFLKSGGDSQASNASAPTTPTQTPTQNSTQPAANEPARKALPRFKGVHTKAAGRVTDARSGLSYARFAKPWAVPPVKSPMKELGFSVSQFAVTEKAGSQPTHWARLMSAQLAGAAKDAYSGPGSERAAATQVTQMYEARMFGFQHKKKLLATQPLNIGGHKGWLVSDYLTYRRAGVRATGDVVAVALVDTGKPTPGILFMSVPNTNKRLWSDINFVVRSLRVS